MKGRPSQKLSFGGWTSGKKSVHGGSQETSSVVEGELGDNFSSGGLDGGQVQ